jgi:hypothetical protein
MQCEGGMAGCDKFTSDGGGGKMLKGAATYRERRRVLMCLVGGKARDTRANKGEEDGRRTNGGGSVVAGWAWTLGTSLMKVGSSWWEGQRLDLYSFKRRSYRKSPPLGRQYY